MKMSIRSTGGGNRESDKGDVKTQIEAGGMN